jgi:threonylcarbamoyladenosine tRNA methylthiotransferase MtaB
VKGYYIENFGCRAAQSDGSAIERRLAGRGMRRVRAAEDAEVVVLNTCTVTSAADQDARAAIRRVRRAQPEAKILVTGCYAQRAPEEIAALDGVTWVVGNSHKDQIGDIVAPSATPGGSFVPLAALNNNSATPISDQNFHPKIYASDIFAHTELHSAPVFDGIERTRPNLKVQDGCDNRCSFCVIPFVRGHSRSLPIEQVLREIADLEAAGYQEIVISGINLGRWGRDFARQNSFITLLSSILDRTSIPKLRLSSVEPMDWTNDLIALMASSERIAKHAHVPLQSGSDRILRKMHRKYRPWHYAEKVEKIRSLLPDAAIGADVMVGFPGESHELFEESRRFIEQLPFTYLHVFTYSPRPGTPAASLPAQVPLEIARERNRDLRQLAAKKNLEFRYSFVDRTLEAITLTKTVGSTTEALSDNYLKVLISGIHEPNRWLTVKVQSVTESGLSGELQSFSPGNRTDKSSNSRSSNR